MAILGAQVFLAFFGSADVWTRGHNGYNGSAYQNSARNSIRWRVPFPVQYKTDNTPPKTRNFYTHAPFALHAHNVASLFVLGDSEFSIRAVAAVHGIAVVALLYFVVAAFWSSTYGLLAAAFYVLLPINAIYVNMANHSSGFIVWSLLGLLCYLRSTERLRDDGHRPWSLLVLLFVSIFAATAWDWPAYYIAFCIAAHWAWNIKGRLITQQPIAKELGQWSLFCLFTLFSFAAHFAFVHMKIGSTGELLATFGARRAVSWASFANHLKVLPELMFTWPVLFVSLTWFGAWFVRLLTGRSQTRDLLPISFLFGGIIHYMIFRRSAVVHSYWAWPLLPFVAVAMATATAWIYGQLHRLLKGRALIAAALSALISVPLLVRDFEIVPQGRHVGGSMWFFTNARGAMDRYDSGRPELRFAKQVRAWTDRHTGVLVHPSFKRSASNRASTSHSIAQSSDGLQRHSKTRALR